MVTGVNISPQTIVDLGGYVLVIIKKLSKIRCGGFSFCTTTREMCPRYCYLGTSGKN